LLFYILCRVLIHLLFTQYTWEQSFEKLINKSRFAELELLRSVAYLRGFSRAYMTALPGIVAVCSFIAYTYAYAGSSSEASTLFAALAAFDQLRFPLLFYPMALAQLAQARVSAARVEMYLAMREVVKGEHKGEDNSTREDFFDERERPTVDSSQGEEKHVGSIELKDVTIYWSDPAIPLAKVDDDSSVASGSKGTAPDDNSTGADEAPTVHYPKPILSDVSFRVAPGELTAVVGRVASGKSTLCSAILNETILGKGTVTLMGKVAYAAQSAWILNATLRDNILFGLPYDEEKYLNVIKACQLTYDLEMLEDGDMTEIGER
jgi:ABC-type multidrug transport system fused ATPase/permease subunit